MPGFADSFWSSDYAGGLGILFGKLGQGIIENQQILTVARLRAEAEDTYGKRIGDIVPATDSMTGGFTRDDGASLRKVCTWEAIGDYLGYPKADSLLRRLTKEFAVKCKRPRRIIGKMLPTSAN